MNTTQLEDPPTTFEASPEVSPKWDLRPIPGSFDTQEQCCGVMSIPMSILQRAKRSGSFAFKGNRVSARLILQWLFQENGDEDWAKECKKADALIKREKLARLQNQSLDKDEVQFVISKAVSGLTNLLVEGAQVYLPPRCKGLSEPELQKILMGWALEVLVKRFKSELEKIGQE